MQKIFVYGSLMSGMSAHKYMSNNTERDYVCRLLSSECVTAEKYAMYIHDGFPFVFEGRNLYNILGELYEISGSLFNRLEGYEGDFYTRKLTRVILGGSEVEAYMFFGRGHFFGMKEVGPDYRAFYFGENHGE